MRLFKGKKGKAESSQPDTTSNHGNAFTSDDAGPNGTAMPPQQQQPQQQQEKAQKFGRGMQAIMNKQPKPMNSGDMVQESIGGQKRD